MSEREKKTEDKTERVPKGNNKGSSDTADEPFAFFLDKSEPTLP